MTVEYYSDPFLSKSKQNNCMLSNARPMEGCKNLDF